MCKAIEDMINEAMDDVRKEASLRMLADGIPIEIVAHFFNLSVERVKEITR